MNQLIRAGVVSVAVVAGLAACASLRVTSDVNAALAGSVHCHTFAWAGSFRANNPLRSGIANPLNESRLRTAISSHLASMGVQPATADADCLIGYGMGAHTAIEGPFPGTWDYGYGWGWHGAYGGPWGWNEPYVYHEGIIAVDLYDGKSKQPVWHASVEQSLRGLTGPAAEQRIEAAVAAIFAKYPH
ncbi:MAG: putative lipoprotein [Gammaproteobacteria bacterium]|nr:putative lipoprotein [Gammaproteobacteria bacterium]